MPLAGIAAHSATAEPSSSSAIRRAYAAHSAKSAAPPANASGITSISQAARDRLAADNDSGAIAAPSQGIQLNGPAYSLAQLAEQKGLPLIAVQMTDAQRAEIKLREQQEAQREQISADYAQAHPYRPLGQVMANGEVVATVYEGGGFEMKQQMAGLSSNVLSPEQRLAEIAQLTHGQVITTHLQPTQGGIYGPAAPESMLPPITARSFSEIFEQEIKPALEQKIQAWEAATGKTYPRTA